jgi:hypothetical protein
VTQTATLPSGQSDPPLAAGLDLSWLNLREAADAAARSRELIGLVAGLLAESVRRPLVIHDLGAGSGSMMRWAAALLPAPQHWVLYDRDLDLLTAATANRTDVTFETRPGDLADLRPEQLGGASLITASALLDMLTGDQLARLMATVVNARCPVLIPLTVTGGAGLDPAEPGIDERVAAAFDDHQRRPVPGRDGRSCDDRSCDDRSFDSDGFTNRLGPDAASRASAVLTAAGLTVITRTTPWRLDAAREADRDLLAAWLDGWVGAAQEQEPDLVRLLSGWLERRQAQLAAGRLRALIPHTDLLALPLTIP